jgi:hypothetical protein
MLKNTFTILLCAVFFGQTVILAQATDKKPPPKKPVEKIVVPIVELSSELKTQVADYLQQNVSLSLTLNSDENRISYLLKTANLLWKIDKTQSQTVFRNSFEDIRKIVMQTDFEMIELENTPDYELSKLVLQKQITAKLKKINVLTLAVTTQVSGSNPQIGYAFFEELKLSIKNEQLRRNFERSVSFLQIPLLSEIAEKSIDNALNLANRRLREQGFFDDSIDLMLTVLKKDPKKANDFAKAILRSLKTAKNPKQFVGSMQRLLQIGKDNLQNAGSAQKPLFTKSELDGLSELIDSFLYNATTSSNKPDTNSLNSRDEARTKLLNEINAVVKGKSDLKLLFQLEIAELIKPIANKKLPSADKKRVIEGVMRKISLVQDSQFRFEMMIWLSQKALQSAGKESATGILLEAELIIKLFPKDLSDFSNNWMLAEAYFGVDENKSFVIVENIFSQLNQVINAYATFNEFLGGETFVESDEVRMESAGNAKVIGLEKLKTPMLKRLAELDFPRTVNLTNRFDRSEFRLEARIMICRAILEPPKKPDDESKAKQQ